MKLLNLYINELREACGYSFQDSAKVPGLLAYKLK